MEKPILHLILLNNKKAFISLFFLSIATPYAQSLDCGALFSPSIEKITSKEPFLVSNQISKNMPPLPLYIFYRLVYSGNTQRRCRLHPTCSHFALLAMQKYGVAHGFFLGMARSQMEHSHQHHFLKKIVAEDGKFIYLDPLENWNHD